MPMPLNLAPKNSPVWFSCRYSPSLIILRVVTAVDSFGSPGPNHDFTLPLNLPCSLASSLCSGPGVGLVNGASSFFLSPPSAVVCKQTKPQARTAISSSRTFTDVLLSQEHTCAAGWDI